MRPSPNYYLFYIYEAVDITNQYSETEVSWKRLDSNANRCGTDEVAPACDGRLNKDDIRGRQLSDSSSQQRNIDQARLPLYQPVVVFNSIHEVACDEQLTLSWRFGEVG